MLSTSPSSPSRLSATKVRQSLLIISGRALTSLRNGTSIEQKEESKGNESQVTLIKEYRQKIENELAKICEDILEVLDQHLIPSAQSGESKVFYHKM